MTRELKLDEVLEELYFLREENQQLKVDNDFLQRQQKEYHEIVKHQEEKIQALNNTISSITRRKLGLKLNNRQLTDERNALIDELDTIKRMSMFEFGNKYCTDDSLTEDGKAFAKALLGGA